MTFKITRLDKHRNYPGLITISSGTRSWKILGDCSDEQAIHSVNELLEAERIGSE